MYALTDEEKPLRRDSALRYIRHHRTDVLDFMRSRVKEWDRVKAIAELSEGDTNPVVFAYILLNSYIMTEWERWSKVCDLVFKAGNLTVMIGAKGFGKTACAFRLMEEAHTRGIKVYWYGFSTAIKRYYPWVIQTLEPEKVMDGILFTDETAVHDAAAGHQVTAQRERMSLLWTSRHRGCANVFISQTFRIDVRILNAMDVLWFKPFFDMDFDRTQASHIFNEAFEYIRPITCNENLVINYQQGHESWIANNDLPKVWNNSLSTPFSMLETREEALEYLGMLEDAGVSSRDPKKRELQTMLLQRGWRLDELTGGREKIVPSRKG